VFRLLDERSALVPQFCNSALYVPAFSFFRYTWLSLLETSCLLQGEKPSASRSSKADNSVLPMADDTLKEDICVEPESEFLIKVLYQYDLPTQWPY
jgi:hypothetical protein